MSWFDIVLLLWTLLPVVLFFILLRIRVPYGRHATGHWGPMIDNHWGWFWMELPALVVFPAMVLLGPQTPNMHTWLLIGLWSVHYINRVLIFPFRIHTRDKKMPLLIAASAFFFNLMNGFVNGYYLGFVSARPTNMTLALVFMGLGLFFAGFIINNRADSTLISLRKSNQGYQIPRGRLFQYISCPNHFGEILEWAGFALAAQNPAALSFAVWTFCNLAPRAKNHHDWYRKHFNDYPPDRKIVIPFLW